MAADPLFYEEQSLRQKQVRILTAIPPVLMTLLETWQVWLGHPWGKHPMSNGSMVAWTVFLWLIYFRLMRVRLVTELWPGELRVAMRGLWRSTRISLAGVKSVKAVVFDAARDWGGYGMRSTKRGRAFLAGGDQGVELAMTSGGIVVIGSSRARELARAINSQVQHAA